MPFKDVLYLIGMLILFAVFFYIVYLTTVFISKFNRGYTGNTNIKIIERVPLMRGQYLVLISLDDSYYLIASSNDQIELIDKVEDLSLINRPIENTPFKDVLSRKILKGLKKDEEI